MMIQLKKIKMVLILVFVNVLDYDVYADAFDENSKGKDGIIDPS